jgi:hypothetical protein
VYVYTGVWHIDTCICYRYLDIFICFLFDFRLFGCGLCFLSLVAPLVFYLVIFGAFSGPKISL